MSMAQRTSAATLTAYAVWSVSFPPFLSTLNDVAAMVVSLVIGLVSAAAWGLLSDPEPDR